MQNVQIRQTDGTWVTVAQPNQEIDLASVAAGATAASLAAGVSVPPGQYDNFKIVVSETVKFSGSDGANYSNSGGAITIAGADAAAASTATWAGFPPNANLTETTESYTANLGSKGEVTATLDLDAGDADNYMEIYASANLGTPMTVTSDSSVSMFFDFDTQGTVIYNDMGGFNNVMYFTPPQAGTQFGITVDGVTTTVTEANMRIDF